MSRALTDAHLHSPRTLGCHPRHYAGAAVSAGVPAEFDIVVLLCGEVAMKPDAFELSCEAYEELAALDRDEASPRGSIGSVVVHGVTES